MLLFLVVVRPDDLSERSTTDYLENLVPVKKTNPAIKLCAFS